MSHITPSELKQLQDVSNLVQSLELKFGSKALELEMLVDQIKLIEHELDAIKENFRSAKESNDKMIQVLIEKYGNCTINLETGKIN